MISKILSLLMCCQVLVCPALCGLKCAPIAIEVSEISASTVDIVQCHCCPIKNSCNGDQSNSQIPQLPCSDCPDCFCSGSLLVGKETVGEIDFGVVKCSAVETALMLPRTQVTSNREWYASPPSAFGRSLLRKNCLLLI